MSRYSITRILSTLMMLSAAWAFAGDGHEAHGEHAEKPEPKAQTHCPILGGEIDKAVFVDYEGKRIYFCCPGCDKKFLAAADEKIKEMEAAGITLEAAPVAQTMCPVSDEPIDKAIWVMHGDRKVFLCCKMCKGKFEKDPETYVKKLDAQAAAHAEHGVPAAHGEHAVPAAHGEHAEQPAPKAHDDHAGHNH